MQTGAIAPLGGDFENIELLGSGTSGSVYRATQRSLQRTVAVKVFHRRAPEQSENILAEARAQGALSWHSSVVSLYGRGVTADGFPYLVMEYCAGGSLSKRVETSGPLSDLESARLGGQLASALAAAHRSGVIHCDVKPSNVLLAEDGSARLADFGIARTGEAASATLDGIEGSLAYVPPELFDGESPAPPNDVYALALTLLFAATGRPPYAERVQTPAALMARIQAGPPSSAGLGGHWSPGGLLHRCLQPDPDDRPSARELETGLAPSVRPDGVSPDGSTGTRRLVLTGFGVLVVLAVLGASMVVLMRDTAGAGHDDPPELCPAYLSFVRSREKLFESASAYLEAESSPYQVLKRVLVDYPVEYASRVFPYLNTARAFDRRIPQVTAGQIAEMSRASVLRDLAKGKSFVFDGQSGEFDPAGLPHELQEPAEAFSVANSLGERKCHVRSHIALGKARMRSAIFWNLRDPDFMNRFFSDSRSFTLFDSSFVLLMASVARNSLEGLLNGHWDWFLDFVLDRGETGRILVTAHPDLLLVALKNQPESVSRVKASPLNEALRAGLGDLGPAERTGVDTMFSDELRALGLST